MKHLIKKISAFFLLVGFSITLKAGSPELRGVWFAWAGSNIPTNTHIAQAMDALADANFNVVYVDVWRFGFPYFKSEVFYKYTGLYTDPAVGNRDILAEMIAEGHRAGLEVDAWFEAGFMATQGSNQHMYQAKPEWFAKDKAGNVPLYGAGGMSLSHTHPEAQQFLIELAKEVVLNYDVDGIEFDRVRYPGLDCGYDSTTIELYKAENDGNEPPQNISDSGWIRWRADKLTEFVAMFYDSLKSVNPDIIISNAPLPWGYDQFCQDWVPWANNGYLDAVQVQMYNSTNSSYVWRLDTERVKMSDQSILYPGISTEANGNITTPSELIEMVKSTRSRGLNGNVFWYHYPLVFSSTYLADLKSSVYSEKVEVPYREPGWRHPAIVVNENDARLVEKSDNWNERTPAQGYNGYEGGLYYTETGNEAWIDYHANISEEGWYEVYVFHYQQAYATTKAPYTVYHRDGETLFHVNQNIKQSRWVKLSDVYLEPGLKKKVIRLSTEDTDRNFVFADAIMLLKTNRVGVSAPVSVQNPRIPESFNLLEVYPNPFNNECTIRYTLMNDGLTDIVIWDLNGRLIDIPDSRYRNAGTYELNYRVNDLSSGIYLVGIKQYDTVLNTKKLVYIK